MFEYPTQGARPVWIASYPRSGNTFLRILLENAFRLPSYSVYYIEGGASHDPSAEALENAPKLPANWRDSLTKGENGQPVLIKTHDGPPDDAPAIFVARDGRAAIHSYFHYHKKFAFEQPSLTEIIAGACQFGSWSDHYWAWRPKNRPKTLLLCYDDLVTRPAETIVRLAEFLRLKSCDKPLPPFEELQRRLPAFFRRGQNTDYLQEWSPAHLALFNELHGSAMQDLGFPVTPSNTPTTDSVRELALSAARLHRLYLEQLTNVGRSVINHREEVQRLSQQIHNLSSQLETTLKTRWVRLGLALGAVEPPSGVTRATETAASARPARPLKASDGNTQLSSPDLAPGELPAPNGDGFARG
jgi:hypothetical protein